MLVSRPCGTESLGHRARSEFRIRYEIVKAGRPWTTRGAEEGPSSTGALSSFKPTLHIVRKQRAVSAESRKLLGVPGGQIFLHRQKGSAWLSAGYWVGDVAGERGAAAPSVRRLQWRDLVAFLALCDRDVEFISYWMEVEGGGSYRGDGGVRRWWESLLPCTRTSPERSRRYESLGS